MKQIVLTGFHAVEEKIRTLENAASSCTVFFSAPAGPRVKKILSAAHIAHITCTETSKTTLDSLTEQLSPEARNHRGLVFVLDSADDAPADSQGDSKNEVQNTVDIDLFLHALGKETPALVVVLDSITDPHNAGAILRSCDQFGVSLAVLPRNRSVAPDNEIVARASAGAVSWLPIAVTSNLVSAIEKFKDAGFWVYGADAGGVNAPKIEFAPRTLLLLGSEGRGISRLLSEHCDVIAAIPTRGKIDSLNVSVAAGILLYEISRQKGF